MKSIATVNTTFPTVDNSIGYTSGDSLRDFDIAIFDPKLPYVSRIDFTGGGSCMSLDGGQRVQAAMSHWNRELRAALKAGKTVFVILNEIEVDSAAIGSNYAKGQRTYSTTSISSYDAIPANIKVKNTKGKTIILSDNTYKGLLEAIKEVAQYKVIIDPAVGEKLFTTKDGAEIAALVTAGDLPGNLVLLPYFNFIEFDDGDEDWKQESLNISRKIVSQLLAIDEVLRKKSGRTPPPDWLEDIAQPEGLKRIDASISAIRSKVEAYERAIEAETKARESLNKFSHLLYESGKPLEIAVENSLKLIGYRVDNLRIGDLEIDHVITGPEGIRMIGETEGKDSSAVEISKFRQLESNINEDFQRDEVDVPAKGVIFGNGFRFTRPAERGEHFTQKCLTNAKRLGTALVRTSDLYHVVSYVLDHPDDDEYKAACRQALESTAGDIVDFPSPNP